MRRIYRAVILVLVLAAGVLTGGPAQAAGSCPSSGAICWYDSQNFNNFLAYSLTNTCDQHGAFVLLPAAYRNNIESVRNRTGCGLFLYYYCGTSICHNEWMAPNSEDGTISPLNAIDGYGLEL
jgi:hypothetical protein